VQGLRDPPGSRCCASRRPRALTPAAQLRRRKWKQESEESADDVGFDLFD